MKRTHAEVLAGLLLLLVAVAYRICTGVAGYHSAWMPNFSPVAAIALCGATVLPKRLAFTVPLAALLLSDLVLNRYYGASLLDAQMAPRYVALALIAALGWQLRARRNFAEMLPAAAVGSTFFYVLTNTGAWYSNPLYAKTFADWAQALTTGIPGLPPTWMFFRNTFVSDILFTGIFVLSLAATGPRKSEAPAASSVPVPG